MKLFHAGLIAGLLTLPLAQPAAAAAHLTYVVYFGLLPALNVATTIDVGEGKYRLTTEVVPQPWISWALPWTAASEANGVLGDDGKITPEHYLSAGTWGVRKRQTVFEFNPDGSLKSGVEPPKPEEGREAVPEDMLKAVLDPVSAVIAMLEAAKARGPGCAPSLPIFDGRRRFEISAKRLPDAVLAPASYTAYAGPAIACLLHFKSLAGVYRDGERSRFWQTDKPGDERPPIDLWLAPLRAGETPMPVYVAGKSILGWVTAYVSSFSFD